MLVSWIWLSLILKFNSEIKKWIEFATTVHVLIWICQRSKRFLLSNIISWNFRWEPYMYYMSDLNFDSYGFGGSEFQAQAQVQKRVPPSSVQHQVQTPGKDLTHRWACPLSYFVTVSQVLHFKNTTNNKSQLFVFIFFYHKNLICEIIIRPCDILSLFWSNQPSCDHSLQGFFDPNRDVQGNTEGVNLPDVPEHRRMNWMGLIPGCSILSVFEHAVCT